jgi:hypothetical protein
VNICTHRAVIRRTGHRNPRESNIRDGNEDENGRIGQDELLHFGFFFSGWDLVWKDL